MLSMNKSDLDESAMRSTARNGKPNAFKRRTSVINRKPLGSHIMSPVRKQMQHTSGKYSPGRTRQAQNVTTVKGSPVQKQSQALAPVKNPTEITPCQKVHTACNHPCGGVAYEKECLPCLEPGCQQNVSATKDDLCAICFTSELGSEPAVKLGCGHIFHA